MAVYDFYGFFCSICNLLHRMGIPNVHSEWEFLITVPDTKANVPFKKFCRTKNLRSFLQVFCVA